MKKCLWALMMVLTAFACKAEEFDEVNLIGEWELTSQNGNLNNVYKSFSTLRMGEFEAKTMKEDTDQTPLISGITGLTLIKDLDDYLTQEDLEEFEVIPVDNFFISNGNKLNILFPQMVESGATHVFKFIIESMTSDKLNLKSYDGKNSFVLTKINGTETKVVNIESDEPNKVTEYYNTNGIRVSKPANGIHIKKNGSKTEKVLY